MRQWLADILNAAEPETVIKDEDGGVVTATYDRSQVEQMLEEISDRFAKNDEMRLGEKAAAEKRVAEIRTQTAAQRMGKDVKLGEYRDENQRLKMEVKKNREDLHDMDREILRLRKENEAYRAALEQAGIDEPFVDSDELIAMDLTKLVWEGPLSFVDDNKAKEELLEGISNLLNRRMKLDEHYLA